MCVCVCVCEIDDDDDDEWKSMQRTHGNILCINFFFAVDRFGGQIQSSKCLKSLAKFN